MSDAGKCNIPNVPEPRVQIVQLQTSSMFKKIIVEAKMALLSLKKDSGIVKGPNDLRIGLQ